jgi:exosortase/archaeosortase family protein
LRKLVFPVCFFLVAIPWPTLIETPLIQALARLNASVVVEILGAIGVPAMQHGNVIEVGTGMVGIDDACSGIRSFQSSLMISLFLGEFFTLTRLRRLILVPVGFLLALGLNVCRTSMLTWIAAKKGTAAISQYHDQAGLTILLVCTIAMWGIAWLLKHFQSKTQYSKAVLVSHGPPDNSRSVASSGGALIPSFSLLLWLGAVEAGVQFWYHSLESRLAPIPNWSVTFPTDNPTFKELPITATTRSLLRFDDGKQGEWGEASGIRWQGFYFNWLPGRIAGYLAKRHTPEICLPAAGRILRSGPTLVMLNVRGVDLPMRQYVFESGNRVIHVFQCRWEAGASKDAYIAQESARYNLVRAIWAGRGKHGQKVLELIASGIDDPVTAKDALVSELEKVVKVDALSVAQNH